MCPDEGTLDKARQAWDDLARWRAPQVDTRELSLNILSLSRKAVRQGNVDLLSTIGREHIFSIAEHLPANSVKSISSQAAELLDDAGDGEAAATWLHGAAACLRRAGNHNSAAKFFCRESAVARAHGLVDRVFYADLGLLSIYTASGNYSLAAPLMNALRKEIPSDRPDMLAQLCLDETKFFCAVGEMSDQLRSADAAFAVAREAGMRPEALAIGRGMICLAEALVGRWGAAYRHGLYATVILLLARMDFALAQFSSSFQTSLLRYSATVEMAHLSAGLRQMDFEFAHFGVVSEGLRQSTVTLALRVYKHFLDHLAGPEAYNNPLRALVENQYQTSN